MDKKINLNLTTNKDNVAVVEFREGSALPLANKKNYSVTGQLASVKEYIGANYPTIVEFEGDTVKDRINVDALILVDKKANKMEFISDIKAEFGRVNITGYLEKNEKLALFEINQNEYFSQKDVERLLKNNAVLFKDFSIVRTLIKALDDLQLTTEETIKDTNDKRGNVDQAFRRVVKDKQGLLPEYIEFFCPIFEGGPKESLKVEVEISLQGRIPVYSFHCLELDLITEAAKDTAFQANITEQMKTDFTLINLS